LLERFEILEEAMPREDIVLANAFKTRIIAEAQIKTDKVDAHILADLLRGSLISRVHVCGKATRECCASFVSLCGIAR
jgi:transposase